MVVFLGTIDSIMNSNKPMYLHLLLSNSKHLVYFINLGTCITF